jgi:UDP-2,4-diacetamido-2,4,6-trideoxy-beta-L-altropyranose hydrolase
MRCLTLAEELKSRGAQVSFLCRDVPGNLINLVENKGYPVVRIRLVGEPEADWQNDAGQCLTNLHESGGIDWLVLDHYRLDYAWESALRPVARNIFVIDDLADRRHDCDVLLDQNYYTDSDNRYPGLVPSTCQMLLGPAYALLRDEFAAARKKLRHRDGCVRRVLVFFGGSDLGNATVKVLQAIGHLKHPELFFDVVVGLHNPHQEKLKTEASNMEKVDLHIQVNNMAELIAASDLYVGAPGTTTWERSCLGLPSLVMTTSPSQIAATRDLHRIGALTYLGEADAITSEQIARALEECMVGPEQLKQQSVKAMMLVDGNGVARCADNIHKSPRG